MGTQFDDTQRVATTRERAQAALEDACDGWLAGRRCTGADGSRLPHPHPTCLQAQYRHDVILLEGGLPR